MAATPAVEDYNAIKERAQELIDEKWAIWTNRRDSPAAAAIAGRWAYSVFQMTPSPLDKAALVAIKDAVANGHCKTPTASNGCRRHQTRLCERLGRCTGDETENFCKHEAAQKGVWP